MSEFSVMSTESEILPTQNIFDLRLSSCELDRDRINELLGMKDAQDGAV